MERLLLKAAPPEIEAILLWAETHKGEHGEPSDPIEYDNAADVIKSLNRYLIELEMAERLDVIESLMRQVGEAAIKFAESLARAWQEVFESVLPKLQKLNDNFIAELKKGIFKPLTFCNRSLTQVNVRGKSKPRDGPCSVRLSGMMLSVITIRTSPAFALCR